MDGIQQKLQIWLLCLIMQNLSIKTYLIGIQEMLLICKVCLLTPLFLTVI